MLWAFGPGPAAHALCGDSSGDGFLSATDALATLRAAVTSQYDARADVTPAGGDGKLVAADALSTLRAAVTSQVPDCAAWTRRRALVSTAPIFFDTAGIALVDMASHQVDYNAGALAPDSVVRWQRGVALGINRKGTNSLQVIDLEDEDLPTIKECSVSDGFDSNPHDVLLLSDDKGYVTLYGGRKLLVIDPGVLDPGDDPACQGMIKDRIDLGGLDPDMLPQMDQMALVDGTLFVSLQRLDTALKAKLPGMIAIIDTTTDTLAGQIELTLTNPYAETKGLLYDARSNRVYVAGPGKVFDDMTDGGIEAVDTVTRQSLGVLATGADLGGDVFDLVVVGSRRAYAVVASEVDNAVVEVDLDSGSITDVLVASSEDQISDIELSESGELWVAFREDTSNSDPGVRIFSVMDNDEITPLPIAIGDGVPFTIAFAQ
ncbi:MAG TPA: hypothetical protein VEC57_05320 [Candidatus Limnocylindrales bacterium]|nr:hypothetical protein [Candidatus Limnocylindrales bacterium]